MECSDVLLSYEQQNNTTIAHVERYLQQVSKDDQQQGVHLAESFAEFEHEIGQCKF
jgi:hypothetical protein